VFGRDLHRLRRGGWLDGGGGGDCRGCLRGRWCDACLHLRRGGGDNFRGGCGRGLTCRDEQRENGEDDLFHGGSYGSNCIALRAWSSKKLGLMLSAFCQAL